MKNIITEIEDQWCSKLEATFKEDPKKYRSLTAKLIAVDQKLECRYHNGTLQAKHENGYLLSITPESYSCSCPSFVYGGSEPCKHLAVLVNRYRTYKRN